MNNKVMLIVRCNLREVGVPSRNILHVRGRGSKSRTRDARYIARRTHRR